MKAKEKRTAEQMRRQGHSLNEIAKKLGVAKSTASLWVRDVELSEKAKECLLSKIKLGQYTSAENKKKRTKAGLDNYYNNALVEIGGNTLDKSLVRIACALMYYCEGNKSFFNGVCFTNSDPALIKTFLFLFRKGFDIDEHKLSACIHLHEYHDAIQQLDFWSRTTGIPESQFIKPYLKPNTGKRIRKNYQGCVAVRYYNNDMGRQLLMIGKAFLDTHKGV